MRRFHLLGHSLVRMLRALPDYLAIPGKLVPPIFALLLLVNHHFPPFFFFFFFFFWPLPFGRPPILPQALSCSFVYFAARVSPPCLPVARKNSITSLGIFVIFMSIYNNYISLGLGLQHYKQWPTMHCYGLLQATGQAATDEVTGKEFASY